MSELITVPGSGCAACTPTLGLRFSSRSGNCNRLDASEGELVTITGRHCESGDVLVDRVPLKAPRVDNLLVAASYGGISLHNVRQLQRKSTHMSHVGLIKDEPVG